MNGTEREARDARPAMTGPPPGTAGSKARLRVWLRLLKLSKIIEAELREKLRREHDTTLPRFDVLAALDRHRDGLRMSALSGVLKVSNGNVTGIIERLVAEGLVERVPVPGDRRATMVRLTGKGRDHFAEQAAAHEAWIDRMLAHLPAEEAAAMGRTLERITDGLEARLKYQESDDR